MFGLHQRSPSADLTANYPLEYVPCRRNSDGNGYGLRNNKKSKYIILNLLLSQDKKKINNNILHQSKVNLYSCIIRSTNCGSRNRRWRRSCFSHQNTSSIKRIPSSLSKWIQIIGKKSTFFLIVILNQCLREMYTWILQNYKVTKIDVFYKWYISKALSLIYLGIKGSK